jgi:DNA-directed RNA polymerase subunit K/omega
MNYKKTNALGNTITRDMRDFNKTGNVYESVAVISKRANQISLEVKQEIAERMEEFNTSALSVDIMDNKEQREVSKYYEKQPKPVLIATQEFLDGKLSIRGQINTI